MKRNNRIIVYLLVIVMLVLIIGWFLKSNIIHWLSPELIGQSAIAQRSVDFNTQFDAAILHHRWLVTAQKNPASEFISPVVGLAADQIKPLPPREIKLQNIGDGRTVVVTFLPPLNCPACQATIYRSIVDNEIGETIATQSTTTFFDAAVDNKKVYYYRLRSVDQKGNQSELSAPIKVMVFDYLPPAAPVEAKALFTADGRGIKLIWHNPDDLDFDSVKIYRSDTVGVKGELLADKIKTTSYIDLTVMPSVVYYYSLAALDQAGNESPLILLTSSGRSNPFVAPPL